MKIPALRTLIKEAISDMEVSLKLSNGKIIHGLARKSPKALSLQIGNNTYFYFWEGKFIKSGTGGETAVTIVDGVDDRSQEWFLKATEEYLVAMHDTYPERFGPLKEVSRPTQDQVDRFFTLTQNETHYLNSKPVEGQEKTFNKMEVEPWDEYDLSNWNSLVRKAKQQGKSITTEPLFWIATKTFQSGTGKVKKGEIYKSTGKTVTRKYPTDYGEDYGEDDFEEIDVELANPNYEYYEGIDPYYFEKFFRPLDPAKDSKQLKLLNKWGNKDYIKPVVKRKDEGNDKIKDPVISETYNDDGRNPYNGFLSTDDTKIVIVRSNEDWEKLATSLGSKGFKHQGSLNPLNPNKGLTQMSNYAKFPYEVEINKTQKLVDFGEHTLSSDIK